MSSGFLSASDAGVVYQVLVQIFTDKYLLKSQSQVTSIGSIKVARSSQGCCDRLRIYLFMIALY